MHDFMRKKTYLIMSEATFEHGTAIFENLENREQKKNRVTTTDCVPRFRQVHCECLSCTSRAVLIKANGRHAFGIQVLNGLVNWHFRFDTALVRQREHDALACRRRLIPRVLEAATPMAKVT